MSASSCIAKLTSSEKELDLSVQERACMLYILAPNIQTMHLYFFEDLHSQDWLEFVYQQTPFRSNLYDVQFLPHPILITKRPAVVWLPGFLQFVDRRLKICTGKLLTFLGLCLEYQNTKFTSDESSTC